MSAQDSRVLVVDEPPVDAERISTDGLGDFAVSIVPSRADARERLDGEPKAVDCVVIGAFDADALGDFLRAVAASNPTVPVVVVATDAISAATVIEAGAAAVITEADADVLAVLEHRISTVIAANCARREPPARAVLEPFSHGKLVALFDGDRRHVAAAGDRLADRVDLLHVVGDCRDGLPCADGALEPTELETHTVRTFFLDGPGGRETAHDLLSSGSVAGAVLDDSRDGRRVDALRRRFLRGFVGGFSVDVATRWARAFSDGRAPLSVIGDGLHELADFDETQVHPLEVEPLGDRLFRVRIPTLYADPGAGFGGLSLEHWQFAGNEFDLSLSARGLTTLLATRWYLAVADGELHRPDEIGPFAPLF